MVARTVATDLYAAGARAETRPARWNLADARTTSDGGTDSQAYA